MGVSMERQSALLSNEQQAARSDAQPSICHDQQQTSLPSELSAHVGPDAGACFELGARVPQAEPLAIEESGRGLTSPVNKRQRLPKPLTTPPSDPLALHPSTGEKKSLVVGINNYTRCPLRCCVNDATAVHAALTRMGFSSQLVIDSHAEALRQATRAFTESLQPGDTAFFFFAGHGAEASTLHAGKHRTSNWLLSCEVPAANCELPQKAIDAHSLLAEMEARQTRFNALVLDCCRDDPLPSESRSLSGGLASMEANGSIIAFSCAPGQRAAEPLEGSQDEHGVYTKHLLEHIETPGLPVSNLFIRVRNAVMKDTAGPQYPVPQVPWTNEALTVEDASLMPITDAIIDMIE